MLTTLRRRFAPAEAAALLDQARLRTRAAGKLPSPGLLLYTDEALQQASSRNVSLYRMAGFAGYSRAADLGCGIGADTLAYLSEEGLYAFQGGKGPGFCDACFTGQYPVAVGDDSERRQMKLFEARELGPGPVRAVKDR